MAQEFDLICDEAEEVKAADEPNPHRFSELRREAAFAEDYVILAGDEFKRTGEQMNTCSEYGGLVAEGRVQRGLAPWDNSVRDIRHLVGAKEEFKIKAPGRDRDIEDQQDTGGASGSGGAILDGPAPEDPGPDSGEFTIFGPNARDRADQTAPAKGQGKRQDDEPP